MASAEGNGSARTKRLFRMVIPAYPAFNIYSRIANITTSLGPLTVATAASKLPGWDVEVIDENNYRGSVPRDKEGRPDHSLLQRLRPADVVGLYGGLTSTIPRLYEVARFYKGIGIPTIAGGQHFVDETIEEGLGNCVDILCLGEGDVTLPELIRAMGDGSDLSSVVGLAYRKNGTTVRTAERADLTNFEEQPLPDFSLIKHARIRVYPVLWVRGCGMNCEFCTVKGRPRPSSIDRVFRQIANLVETVDARHFFLVDDLFGQHRKETLALCKLLADYQEAIGFALDITVQIRLDRANDAELLAAMRSAGVNVICIGFESPIPEELEAMRKRLKPEDMVALARKFHKAGFLVHGMFIFGYPLPEGATFSMPTYRRVRAYRKFIRAARIDTVQVLLPVTLPGTEMTARLRRQNRVFATDLIGWEYYDGNFPVFKPDPPVTPEEMHAAMRRIMGRFYRFRYMFAIGLHVLVFPSIVFSLHNLKVGWNLWYRAWRNSLVRFGGWMTIRRWTQEFNKGTYTRKLDEAKKRLGA